MERSERNTKLNIRKIVLDLLIKEELSKTYSNIALDTAIKRYELTKEDKGFLSALFLGVIERKITLDYIISKLSSIKLKDLDDDALCLLRMGIYQLRYMDKVPSHASVNETVDLARKRSRGFINAILRSYDRQKDEIKFPSKDNFSYYLSIYYSVTEELAKRLILDYGNEKAEEFLKSSFIRENSTTFRVNTLKISREELIDKLVSRGITVEKTKLSQKGIKIYSQISDLAELKDGLMFVQDEASIIQSEVLSAKENDTVFDICSCPGGKSFSASIDMHNRGQVLAFDLHENKLSLVENGAKKLGIDIIKTKEQDGRILIDELVGKADKIICDVPCSGFGVISKKPEIRYKNLSESDKLPEIQSAILSNSANYLKVGGTLVYSTCTILKAENENIIFDFLANHKNFSLSPFEIDGIKNDGYVTLMPQTHSTDGFFIAKIIKNN